jgi:hypothetical protein
VGTKSISKIDRRHENYLELMSIINNANSGSQIALTCMIYRVIGRNPQKFSVDDITAICRPPQLGEVDNQRGKFSKELKFWLRPEHSLWQEDENKKLLLTSEDPSISLTAISAAISRCLTELFFSSPSPDLFKKPSDAKKDFYQLIIFLTCLLTEHRFLPHSSRLLSNNDLRDVFHYLPHEPNSNETGKVIEWGVFLGYLTQKSLREFVIDPTAAIRSVLPSVFLAEETLTAVDFVARLSRILPIVDRGVYWQQVESEMRRNGWTKETPDNLLSAPLSYALERLDVAKVIRLQEKADDEGALTLHHGRRFGLVQMIGH